MGQGAEFTTGAATAPPVTGCGCLGLEPARLLITSPIWIAPLAKGHGNPDPLSTRARPMSWLPFLTRTFINRRRAPAYLES